MKKMAVSAVAALTLLLGSALPAMAATQGFNFNLLENERKPVYFVTDDSLVSLDVLHQYSDSRTNVDYRLYEASTNTLVDEASGRFEIDGDITRPSQEVSFTWRNLKVGVLYYLEVDNDSRDSNFNTIRTKVEGKLYI
ncbi:hypothetical protein NQ117_15205 [Paenibacillus sp. SC116]|uniref:hypothetical protein n=1 Tax=Paenibacillus sp. SC116 TaxID=2968986 RepID=UPI00215A1261|nr:hypothetical protein [Paenibacillus sp. SC116]MCR8845029.1 hypothetical protein [Paenibacillus sp. SC116]